MGCFCVGGMDVRKFRRPFGSAQALIRVIEFQLCGNCTVLPRNLSHPSIKTCLFGSAGYCLAPKCLAHYPHCCPRSPEFPQNNAPGAQTAMSFDRRLRIETFFDTSINSMRKLRPISGFFSRDSFAKRRNQCVVDLFMRQALVTYGIMTCNANVTTGNQYNSDHSHYFPNRFLNIVRNTLIMRFSFNHWCRPYLL